MYHEDKGPILICDKKKITKNKYNGKVLLSREGRRNYDYSTGLPTMAETSETTVFFLSKFPSTSHLFLSLTLHIIEYRFKEYIEDKRSNSSFRSAYIKVLGRH